MISNFSFNQDKNLNQDILYSFSEIKKLWNENNWSALVHLDVSEVKMQPRSDESLALISAALFQLDQPRLAKNVVQNIENHKHDASLVARILVASVHNNLAAANALIDNVSAVMPHYKEAIDFCSSERIDNKVVQCRMIQHCNSIQNKFGFEWSEPVDLLLDKAIWSISNHDDHYHDSHSKTDVLTWVQQCIEATDINASIDQLRQGLLSTQEETVRLSFYLSLASALATQKKDKVTALSYVQFAKHQMRIWTTDTVSAVSEALVSLGQALLAAEFIAEMAVKGIGPIFLHKSVRNAINKANLAMYQAVGQKSEHGHDLLLSVLSQKIFHYKASVAPRMPVLIEIGTTREDVPGQGSTRKIALFCKNHDIGFVTVDMDPHNSLLAREMFIEMGLSHFQAITMKGEDYLRQYQGMLDFVFLDAYDFDHGKHSEIRQSRYEQFLGARIDELQCHQMHLDCAESVLAKLAPEGLVCVDDTWLDNGKWTAKGTLAIPFLLANGFTVLESRNRAALLSKT